jgi:hypothetical protein
MFLQATVQQLQQLYLHKQQQHLQVLLSKSSSSSRSRKGRLRWVLQLTILSRNLVWSSCSKCLQQQKLLQLNLVQLRSPCHLLLSQLQQQQQQHSLSKLQQQQQHQTLQLMYSSSLPQQRQQQLLVRKLGRASGAKCRCRSGCSAQTATNGGRYVQGIVSCLLAVCFRHAP